MERADAKLADFADIAVSGNRTTAGFGTLDSRMEDRSLSDVNGYNVTANVELGKFLPAKLGVHIPAYINISNQVSTPEYDPATGDILLKDVINAASSAHQRDSIKTAAEDYSLRRSINFTNVHKAYTRIPKAKKAFLRCGELERYDFLQRIRAS